MSKTEKSATPKGKPAGITGRKAATSALLLGLMVAAGAGGWFVAKKIIDNVGNNDAKSSSTTPAPVAAPAKQPSPPEQAQPAKVWTPPPVAVPPAAQDAGQQGQQSVSATDQPAPPLGDGQGPEFTPEQTPEQAVSPDKVHVFDKNGADQRGASGQPLAPPEGQTQKADGEQPLKQPGELPGEQAGKQPGEPGGKQGGEGSGGVVSGPVQGLDAGQEFDQPQQPAGQKSSSTPSQSGARRGGAEGISGGQAGVKPQPSEKPRVVRGAADGSGSDASGSDASGPERIPVSGRVLSMYREDSVVRLGFVEDLARVLVENYWPPHTRPDYDNNAGMTTLNIRHLNGRYGNRFIGFKVPEVKDAESRNLARVKVLTYVMAPEMLQALEKLYADNFMKFMNDAALHRLYNHNGQPRSLTQPEQADMYKLYAREAKNLASALRNYSRYPEAYNAVSAFVGQDGRAQHAALAYSKGRQAGLTGTRLADLEADYKKQLEAKEKARNAITAFMSHDDARNLDPDTLAYIASWAKRRGPVAAESLGACADLLDRMAGRFEQAATEVMNGGIR